MRLIAVVAASLTAAVMAASLTAQSNTPTSPTSAEQLFLYEVNRARSNPQAYDTEKGLGGVCNGITPARPLALNERLVTSSRFHSTEMATHGYFAHTSPITGHHPNKMVRNAGYALKSAWTDNANYVESLAGTFTSGSSINYEPTAAVRALILDAGVNPPGHRYHLLAWGGDQNTINFNRAFVEAGPGYATGIGANGMNSGAYWSFHTGVKDATNHAFITGVVYDDLNDNGRFDAGEALSGVSVKLFHKTSSSGSQTATTGAGGGYVFQVANGTWVLEVSGGAFNGTRWAQVVVASNANVQVDFRSDHSNADINFGSFGALADSASVDGSQPISYGSTGGGGGGGGGGTGGGGTSNGEVDYGGSGGCAATRSAGWLWMLALLAGVGLLARRKRTEA